MTFSIRLDRPVALNKSLSTMANRALDSNEHRPLCTKIVIGRVLSTRSLGSCWSVSSASVVVSLFVNDGEVGSIDPSAIASTNDDVESLSGESSFCTIQFRKSCKQKKLAIGIPSFFISSSSFEGRAVSELGGMAPPMSIVGIAALIFMVGTLELSLSIVEVSPPRAVSKILVGSLSSSGAAPSVYSPPSNKLLLEPPSWDSESSSNPNNSSTVSNTLRVESSASSPSFIM